MSKAQRQQHNPQDHLIRLKTIVRRLPPHLPEHVFWQSVANWVTDDAVTWKSFHPGKLRTEPHKENIPSRAYIAFKTEEQIAQFSKEFDGHVFRDKQGRESQAVVEFAPFQKVPPPPERVKPDSRTGTLEKDDDFRTFVTALKAPPAPIPDPTDAHEPPSEIKLTPLLEALLAEKTILKARDAAGRQNAQDAARHGAGSTKDVPDVKGASRPPKAGSGSGPSHNKGKEPDNKQANPKPDPDHKLTRRGKRAKHNPSNSQGSNQLAAPPVASPSVTKTSTTRQAKPLPSSQPPQSSKAPHNDLPHKKPTSSAAHSKQAPSTPPVKRKPPVPANNTEQPRPAPPPAKNEVQPNPPPSVADSARPRRGRPVISMGRQFAAALNHAGVPGQRKDDQTSGKGA